MTSVNLPCQRALFDIPDDVAYLNCAYMAPLLRSSVTAGNHGLRRKSRPWTITAADFFHESEHTRALFAALVGASPGDVALVPSASYGLSVAAMNVAVGRGQRILVLDEQFPSNVYPWLERTRREGAEVVTVSRPPDGDWAGAVIERIDARTAGAALPHCHWTDGSLVDLVAVARALHERNAFLVVDATQSLGALPFALAETDPDFVAAAAYKWLLGPYSLGFLYAAPRHQYGVGLEHNWITREGAEDFSGLVRYRQDMQPGARRYDVGERANFALMPATRAALAQLLAWGTVAIQQTLTDFNRSIAEAARDMGLTVADDSRRAGHFLGLRHPGGFADDTLERLKSDGVFVSIRGDSLRVTPHLYNHEGDARRLLAALERLVGRPA